MQNVQGRQAFFFSPVARDCSGVCSGLLPHWVGGSDLQAGVPLRSSRPYELENALQETSLCGKEEQLVGKQEKRLQAGSF